MIIIFITMGRLKRFDILLDSQHNVYYPGDLLRGKCVLELRNELKVKTVNVSIKGTVRVHWTETQNSTSNLAFYTENINSEVEYFFEKKNLFHSDDTRPADALEKGVHEFGFSFQLPSSGLSTSFEGKYGSIRYWIKAEVEKAWSFNYRTIKAFTLICPININCDEYLNPVRTNVDKTFCCFLCTPGSISFIAKTDRKGYCPGETIAISAEFENHTRRTVIPHATLYQTQIFQADNKIRTRNVKFATLTGLAVQPHKTAIWDGQLLKIPVVSPTILNCRLVRVEYSVRIAMHIPLLGYKCFADLPIVIGTVPMNPILRTQSHTNSLINPDACLTSFPTGNINRPDIRHMLINDRDDSGNDQCRNSNMTPPPTYHECIDCTVDIRDDEEGELVGDTRFIPRYIYAHTTFLGPPPAYCEIDPYPK